MTETGFSRDLRTQQSWLFNLFLYLLYAAWGAPAVVLSKVLVVAALGLLLLRLSWTHDGWVVPALSTALALLAMSTRLLLQPPTLSYLLLAVTLWCLRPRGVSAANGSLLPPWLLLATFIIWANVSTWFVLGLAVVALVWAGQLLDRGKGQEPSDQRPVAAGGRLWRTVLGLAILAAACLLNPFHVGAFGLPVEVSRLGGAGTAPAQLMSPFDLAYVRRFGSAGGAYWLLFGLGLLSFVLNRARWQWQRVLPWLALCLLSALQARAVPFFAVVGGPVLAWNLQEYFASRLEQGRHSGRAWRQAIVAARAISVLICLALLLCAWPGRLQAPPYEPRRLIIDTPASLELAATTVKRWHEQGRLGSATRGLHLSPDSAYAFAWFCPEEKSVRDQGLASGVVGAELSPDPDRPPPADWPERMRSARIDRVIVYDSNRLRLYAVLSRLFADPGQWALLYLQGDVAIFGWRDPSGNREAARGGRGGSDPFRGWEVDFHRLAFGAPTTRPAPRNPADREPERRRWWHEFWKAVPSRPVDRDEATIYLLRAEALQPSAARRHVRDWELVNSSGLVGAAAGWSAIWSLADARLRLALRPVAPAQGPLPALERLGPAGQQAFTLQRDDVPPALLLLALRSARRAVASNPDDAEAYLVLGEVYVRLLRWTRERAWIRTVPDVLHLRHAQATAALHQAVALKPQLARGHHTLSALYTEIGCLDLALHHLQAYLELTAQRGEPAKGEYDKESNLARAVGIREKAFLAQAGGVRVLDRALLANEQGLTGKARELLLASDVSAFGRQGLVLELELLLRTGRAKQVRDWILPEHQPTLGHGAYQALRAQAFGATGDYALAEQELLELAGAGRSQADGNPRTQMAVAIAQALLDGQPALAGVPQLALRAQSQNIFRERIAESAQALSQQADAHALRGLLLLEEGQIDRSAIAFRQALATWRDDAAAASGAGLDFYARAMAQDCLAWLEQARTRR